MLPDFPSQMHHVSEKFEVQEIMLNFYWTKGYLISRIVAVKNLGYGKTENIWEQRGIWYYQKDAVGFLLWDSLFIATCTMVDDVVLQFWQDVWEHCKFSCVHLDR